MLALAFEQGSEHLQDELVESADGLVLSKAQERVQKKAIEKQKVAEAKQLAAEQRKAQRAQKGKKKKQGGSDEDPTGDEEADGERAAFENPLSE